VDEAAGSPLVPDGFRVPPPLVDDAFRLEPLGRTHDAEDHRAWTSSIDHIRRTSGFSGRAWPGEPESREDNLLSLEQHERDFAARKGFAYAVRDARTSAYLGCVYLYPPRTPEHDVDVRSWVRTEHAALDAPLHDAVRRWLRDRWPWERPDYARR
jgi:hypothetical protein